MTYWVLVYFFVTSNEKKTNKPSLHGSRFTPDEFGLPPPNLGGEGLGRMMLSCWVRSLSQSCRFFCICSGILRTIFIIRTPTNLRGFYIPGMMFTVEVFVRIGRFHGVCIFFPLLK